VNKDTVERFRQGDKTAFSLLVERFQKPLFSYLGKMGLPQAVCEEVAQETFIRAWQACNHFDPLRSAIGTWLFTIARRLAINELQRAAHRYESTHTKLSFTNDACDASETQTRMNLSLSKSQQFLYQALQTLSAEDRSLLALAYLRELDFKTIAKIEDIPVGTVKSRLYRIREQLKTTLKGGKHDE